MLIVNQDHVNETAKNHSSSNFFVQIIVIRSNSIASPVGEAQQMLNQLSYNAGPWLAVD